MRIQNVFTWIFMTLAAGLLLAACSPARVEQSGGPMGSGSGVTVLAAEAFLADITQQVAGDRLVVETLIPQGVDPHSYQPTPADVARLANAQVLVINGAGLEEGLEEIFTNAEGELVIVEASEGLQSRTVNEDEAVADEDDHGQEGDPHFWLDPNLVIHYVENIRQGLAQADPDGAAAYEQNAAAYIERLQALDKWIQEQVAHVPVERRLLVTNHESLGYFADRYGFTVIGTIIHSVGTGASPSAQEMASLVNEIRATGAPAIFLETGANRRLAEQIAAETGVKIAPALYSHSPSSAGESAGYIEMMEHNTRVIVDALK